VGKRAEKYKIRLVALYDLAITFEVKTDLFENGGASSVSEGKLFPRFINTHASYLQTTQVDDVISCKTLKSVNCYLK